REFHVTGGQTCALPICNPPGRSAAWWPSYSWPRRGGTRSGTNEGSCSAERTLPSPPHAAERQPRSVQSVSHALDTSVEVEKLCKIGRASCTKEYRDSAA